MAQLMNTKSATNTLVIDSHNAKIGLIRTLKRRTFGHLIGQHSDSDVGIYSDTFC